MFGLIAVTRHDLVLLVLPASAFAVWRNRRSVTARSWLSLAAIACLPLAAWTLFSLFYYGSPWPNTAYAKLNTGFDRADLVAQGIRYLQAAVLQDAVTPAVIAAGLIICLRSRLAAYRFVAAGVLLNVIYVVSVGGDFMLGRFLSYAYLVGVCVLIRESGLFSSGFSPAWTLGGGSIVKQEYGVSTAALTGAAVVLYAVLFTHTPVNCLEPGGAGHVRYTWGVASERDFFPELALFEYMRHSEQDGPWPTHPWAAQARQLPHSADFVHAHTSIGMRGYAAGPDKIIVDTLALADPLLARLPAEPGSWIGHFRRQLPAGYLVRLEAMAADRLNVRDARNVRHTVAGLRPWRRDMSIERIRSFSRTHAIAPPELNELYTRLAIVTQSDLWSMERLKTILLFNLGAYDHLTDG